ncbi:hypothetical protein AGOR_G00023820 [Albula goreensis]|uniref:Uncharacterized protein n=1 Tax=Albula goreensis TaxID=1534307 RepID=A0A8T3E0Q7_9TELE|nr:hypothetical protein AGOR_G00023820 [Albula goreensis]
MTMNMNKVWCAEETFLLSERKPYYPRQLTERFFGTSEGFRERNALLQVSSLQVLNMRRIAVLLTLLTAGVFTAPVMKEEEAKQFIRPKRQAQYSDTGYWDPYHSQNQWGYTIQEQVNEYWTMIRADAQYYMDMGSLMFDRAVAIENNKLYMDMLRNTRAHLDGHTDRH